MSASRFTVACCMRASVGRAAWSCSVVEPPGPLHRAGAEHERAARVAVERRGGASRCRTRRSSRSPGAAGRRSPSSSRAASGPAGRAPLSRSSSHSKPSVPVGERRHLARRRAPRRSVFAPEAQLARRPPGTASASLRTPFTVKIVPVSAFSGRPPSAGGLKRGSRQVPVHAGVGIDLRVRVRLLVGDERAVRRSPSRRCSAPSASSRTPRCRRRRRGARRRRAPPRRSCAAPPDQYSSWPTERKTSCSSSSAPRRSRVDAGRVADVVAVALEPAQHRVLGVEEPAVDRAARVVAAARGEGPVVADLVGAARPARRCRGCCRRRCCRPARWCRRSGTGASESPSSSRTTNTTWLARPSSGSSRTSFAR